MPILALCLCYHYVSLCLCCRCVYVSIMFVLSLYCQYSYDIIMFMLSLFMLSLSQASVVNRQRYGFAGQKVVGLNPIKAMWDLSSPTRFLPSATRGYYGLWAGTATELHPVHGCVFDGVDLITWPAIMAGEVVTGPGLSLWQ